MPAGRPRKPAHLRLVEGNRSRRPIPVEPKPDPTMPIPPDWLSDGARATWDHLAPQLHAMGLLTSVDGEAFAALCQCYDRWREAEKILNDYGTTYHMTNTRGASMEMPRPEVALANKYLEQYQKLLAKFGLSPAARASLGKVGDKGESDPFVEAMSG